MATHRNVKVYVIRHPGGHTTVRTSSLGSWLDTPEAAGYTQTEATMQWDAAEKAAVLSRVSEAA